MTIVILYPHINDIYHALYDSYLIYIIEAMRIVKYIDIDDIENEDI